MRMERWLLPTTLALMFSIFTQCDVAALGRHMWSPGRVLRAVLFIVAMQV